jgi:hypothetical protein
VKSCTSVLGLRGSVFTRLEELEVVAVRVSPSWRRKIVERSKLHIENFRETSSQKSEKSRSGWASLNNRQASPLTTWFPWWIRKCNTSCAGRWCQPSKRIPRGQNKLFREGFATHEFTSFIQITSKGKFLKHLSRWCQPSKRIPRGQNYPQHHRTSTNAIIYDHYLVTISCLVIEVLFAVTKRKFGHRRLFFLWRYTNLVIVVNSTVTNCWIWSQLTSEWWDEQHNDQTCNCHRTSYWADCHVGPANLPRGPHQGWAPPTHGPTMQNLWAVPASPTHVSRSLDGL